MPRIPCYTTPSNKDIERLMKTLSPETLSPLRKGSALEALLNTDNTQTLCISLPYYSHRDYPSSSLECEPSLSPKSIESPEIHSVEASIIGARKTQEDTQKQETFTHSILGKITLNGVWDGHGGSNTSKYMEQNAFKIIQEKLSECSDNSPQIIAEVFKNATQKWQELLPYSNDGCTTTILMILHKTNDIFFYTIGDGRITCHNETGEILTVNKTIIDLENNNQTYENSEATNRLQRMKYEIKKKGQLTKLNYTYIPVTEEELQKYECECPYQLEEWKTFMRNSRANPTKTIQLPKKESGAMRLNGFEPCRATSYSEKLPFMGVVVHFTVEDLSKLQFFTACDGLEANNAISFIDFSKIFNNINYATTQFLHNNSILNHIENIYPQKLSLVETKYPRPKHNSPLLDQVEWLFKLITECPSCIINNDFVWKNALYTNRAIINKILNTSHTETTMEQKIQFILAYGVLRGSDDNQTAIYTYFD